MLFSQSKTPRKTLPKNVTEVLRSQRDQRP